MGVLGVRLPFLCVGASVSVTFFGSLSGSLSRFFPSFPLIPAQALTFRHVYITVYPHPPFSSSFPLSPTAQPPALTLRPETLSSSRHCCSPLLFPAGPGAAHPTLLCPGGRRRGPRPLAGPQRCVGGEMCRSVPVPHLPRCPGPGE